MPTLASEKLRESVRHIFAGLGASEEEVKRLQDHLVESNLIGYDSHGVRLIPDYVDLIRKGRLVLGAQLQIVRESPSHLVLDGHWGLGQLLAWQACNMAVEKAKAGAVAIVTVRNCNHIARLGEYTEMMAEKGCVGFITVNGHGGAQLAAPYGGIDRRLSVNPLSYGIPAPGQPIVVDISTTVVAAGKVIIKALRGEQVPDGWLMDYDGNPTTDATLFGAPHPASLIPAARHKGYALSIVVEVLAGALSGAACSHANPEGWGNATFIMALNPAAFVDEQDFADEISELVAYIKSSRPAPGRGEILIPGEPERQERARRSKDGIFVEDVTWNRITAIMHEVDDLAANPC
jgi:hydroxycarboxylate dehydrogenase B